MCLAEPGVMSEPVDHSAKDIVRVPLPPQRWAAQPPGICPQAAVTFTLQRARVTKQLSAAAASILPLPAEKADCCKKRRMDIA